MPSSPWNRLRATRRNRSGELPALQLSVGLEAAAPAPVPSSKMALSAGVAPEAELLQFCWGAPCCSKQRAAWRRRPDRLSGRSRRRIDRVRWCRPPGRDWWNPDRRRPQPRDRDLHLPGLRWRLWLWQTWRPIWGRRLSVYRGPGRFNASTLSGSNGTQSGALPANANDPAYQSGIGAGGACSINGRNGLAVVNFIETQSPNRRQKR
jgi:hypothetical protein